MGRSGRLPYLRGADPKYKRTDNDILAQWKPISVLNGRTLERGMVRAIIGEERAFLPLSVDADVPNMPTERLARKLPQFLIREKHRKSILEAVARGQVMGVIKQLDRGVTADVRDGAGVPALHWAAALGHVRVADVLIQRGADLNAIDCHEMTALHWAANNGQESIAVMLIAAGARINTRDYGKATPILLASSKGHYRVVEALIQAGADVCLVDDTNMSPLHFAALYGRHQTAGFLMAAGADVHETSKQRNMLFGRTPLQFATHNDIPGIVTKLLRRGASPKETGLDSRKWTPVHFAACFGSVQVLEILLDAWPGGLEVLDDDGDTPLHLAADYGRVRVCELLSNLGADVDAYGKDGETPLYRAIKQREFGVIDLLVDKGVDMDLSVGGLSYTEFAWANEDINMANKLQRCKVRSLPRHLTTETSTTQLMSSAQSKMPKAKGRANDAKDCAYEYTQLPGLKFTRLIHFIGSNPESNKIFISLDTVSIDTARGSYIALSYAGNCPTQISEDRNRSASKDDTKYDDDDDEGQEIQEQSIYIVDERLPDSEWLKSARPLTTPLGSNLSDFLTYLVRERLYKSFPTVGSFYLWVDAICINQADKKERASQMAVMSEIYRNADRVVAWLGKKEPDLDFDKLYDRFLPLLKSYDEMASRYENALPWWSQIMKCPTNDGLWAGKTHIRAIRGTWSMTWSSYCGFFNRRRWFSRARILQQACVAEKLSFACGWQTAKAEDMYQLANFVYTKFSWDEGSGMSQFDRTGLGVFAETFSQRRCGK